MVLYLVVEWVDYEGPYPYGVYSTKEKAQEAIDTAPRGTFMTKKNVEINEIPLDKPMVI